MTLATEPVRTVSEICALLAGNEASELSPPEPEAACLLMERTPVMQDRGTPAPRGQTPPERHRRQAVRMVMARRVQLMVRLERAVHELHAFDA